MAIYIVDVLATGFLSMFIVKEYDDKGIETYQSKRKKVLCLLLILILWVSLFAARGITGGDAIVYRGGYKHIFNDHLTLQQCFDEYRDKLYITVVYFCTNLSNGSWVFGCTIIGLLIYTPIIVLIGKKSDDINLSCLLYLFTYSAFFAFNGVRQAIAGSLAIFAYYFGLRERKYFRYGVILLIAYGFHSGTLFAIPFQLLSMKKLKKASTFFMLFVFFGISVVLNQVWGEFSAIFSSNELISKYSTISFGNGSSILRVVVSLIPVILGFVFYPRLIKQYSDADHDVLMGIFCALFMLYSMFQVSFSQMSQFFLPSFLILYPKLIAVSNDRRNLKYLVILLYFVYMILLINNGDSGINPYIPVWESNTY